MNEQQYQHLFHFLSTQTYPPNIPLSAQRQLKIQSHNYFIQNNLLFKFHDPYPLRVVQASEKLSLLRRIHQDSLSGHFGTEKTYQRAIHTYTWPKMKQDIQKFISTCDTCQRRGKGPNTKPFHSLPVTTPFIRVEIDLL